MVLPSSLAIVDRRLGAESGCEVGALDGADEFCPSTTSAMCTSSSLKNARSWTTVAV
jgi:hypothetical protein